MSAPILAPNLQALALAHGFFGRQGGASLGLFASLNCGLGSGDDPASIAENRKRVCHTLQAEALCTPHQTHSADVVEIDSLPAQPPQADALITRQRGLAIGVVTADCVPILLCDRQASVVAVIHAGWRGAASALLPNTLEAMGVAPDSLCAAIGPAIQQDSYEVGADMREQFLAQQPQAEEFFRPQEAKFYFNLPAFIAHTLAQAGIADIYQSGLCTYANPTQFFSYRYNTHQKHTPYGRQVSAIVLAP